MPIYEYIRFTTVCAAILILGCGSAVAADATFSVENLQVAMSLPPSFCYYEDGAEELRAIAKGNGLDQGNRIIAAFAACGEIKELKKGQRTRLDNYGSVMTPTRRGELRMMTEISKAEFVQAVRKQTPQVASGAKDAFKRMQSSGSIVSATTLGVVRDSPDVLVVAHAFSRPTVENQSEIVVGVTALTLVSPIPISINIYSNSRDGDILDRLSKSSMEIIGSVQVRRR